MLDTVKIKAHADRIRASEVLGRSSMMYRLLDFLVDCSLTGKVPKEVEVAIDVFGRSASFAVSQDATVRVYIHKLRRKLEEYYAGPGHDETQRLVIPKGEYRLIIEAPQETAEIPVANEAPPAPLAVRRYWPTAALALLLLLANVFVWLFLRPGLSPAKQDASQMQASPL